jgi:hypothetical protein
LTILLSKTLKAFSSAVPRVQVSARYITTVLLSILYNIILVPLERRCDVSSFLRLKYERFPDIIILVISSSTLFSLFTLAPRQIKSLTPSNWSPLTVRLYFSVHACKGETLRFFVLFSFVCRPSILPSFLP